MQGRQTKAADRSAPVGRERPEAVVAARRRPMAERLELALGWNELASELRDGVRRARARGR